MKTAMVLDAPGRVDGDEYELLLRDNGLLRTSHVATWNEDDRVWRTEDWSPITMCDLDPMGDRSAVLGAYSYVSSPISSELIAYGWDVEDIVRPDLAYAAGLHLCENVGAETYAPGPGVYSFQIVYYPFEDGDTIDPTIAPDDSGPDRNVGVELVSQTHRGFGDTGWQSSPIGTPVKPVLKPHGYARWKSGSKDGLVIYRIAVLLRYESEVL